MKNLYTPRIERLTLAKLNKKMKNRIYDFSFSFYGKVLYDLVKYFDAIQDKVDFLIRLKFKYINDEGKEEECDMDMTVGQFYSIYNDFQKIETIVKTLI
jgi:hypothetical protein